MRRERGDGGRERARVYGNGGTGTGATGTGERRIPLRGARRAVADKLSRSRREIPEATVWVDVDATDLVETRRALNAADSSRPVSLLALLARFTILGLRRYPELNARIEDDEIVVPDAVNLGFAAQTDHGLVVPVVHDAHRLTTRDLSARLAERTAAARDRRLSPADLAGGTFTVNNYGVFGVDGSAAIINHPGGRDPRHGPGHRPPVGGGRPAHGAEGHRAHAVLRPSGVRRRHGGRVPPLRRRLHRVARCRPGRHVGD